MNRFKKKEKGINGIFRSISTKFLKNLVFQKKKKKKKNNNNNNNKTLTFS